MASGTILMPKGLTIDTLWTNSSSTSSFAAQTVTLSAGASGYKILMFEYIFSTTTRDHSTVSFPVTSMQGGDEFTLKINAGSYNRTGVRNCTLATDTTITFVGASYNAASNNAYVIPIAIYGIK